MKVVRLKRSCRVGGRWRLYYSGTQEAGSPWQGIGLAITDLESTETFEGVKIGFKRVGGV